MAETDLFPLQPDYPVARRVLSGVIDALAESGRRFARVKRAPRLVHELELRLRSTSEKMLLEEWYRRFEKSWFSLRDPVFAVNPDTGSYLERYFSVEFAREPDYEIVTHESWNLRVALVDRIGAPLFSYPDPLAGHSSVFLEETELAATQGTWSGPVAHADAHGGQERSNAGTVTTDYARWVYAGYGFRWWSRRGVDQGKAQILLDGVVLATVDTYDASGVAAAPLFSKLDLPLGLHTVELRPTNTKNPASSAYLIAADALEVLI